MAFGVPPAGGCGHIVRQAASLSNIPAAEIVACQEMFHHGGKHSLAQAGVHHFFAVGGQIACRAADHHLEFLFQHRF
jgi:hypothetical protein